MLYYFHFDEQSMKAVNLGHSLKEVYIKSKTVIQ